MGREDRSSKATAILQAGGDCGLGQSGNSREGERERKRFCIFQDGEDRFAGGFE